jgi:serine/threonine protein kinase
MSIVAACVFRDTLLGVKVLHDNRWLHGDLKPPNIRLIGTPPRPVLLDTGGAVYLELGAALQLTPGSGGTIDYIAPERELEPYNHSVDIWSLGCLGYELTYGYHPWRLALNPWRDDKRECELMRPVFHSRYQKTMEILTRDSRCANSSQQFIQRKCLSVTASTAP